jgi:DNA polymerase III gamma/tau subunit
MLHTKYRPTDWQEFAGNTQAVKLARGSLARWLAERQAGTATDGLAIQICGISGAGKTTASKLLAAEAGATEMDVMHVDGDGCNVELVRALEQSGGFLHCRPWGRSKAILVDESHAMTPRAVQAWLNLLERLPKWCLVVFTSTESPDVFGTFAGPFARRCVQVAFTNQGLAQTFTERLLKVAENEGIPLEHKQALRLVQDCKNNLGRAIEELNRLALTA